jgi:hypothetical protein
VNIEWAHPFSNFINRWRKKKELKLELELE